MKKSCLLAIGILFVLLNTAKAKDRVIINHHPLKIVTGPGRPLSDVSIAVNQSTVCVETSLPQLSFTATYTGSGSINYKWKKNGNDIQGATNSIYLTTNYRNGDVFTCITYTPSFPGVGDTSNASTITVTNSTPVSASACGIYFFKDSIGPYTTSGNYQIIIPQSGDCDSVFYLNLTIDTAPPRPSIVNANTEVCSYVGSTASFSLSSPNNALYHKWTAPFGSNSAGPWSATILSGQGSETVGLGFTSNLANKLLYLQVYDSTTGGCVSEPDTLLLTMTLPALDTAFPISGFSSLCTSQLNNQSYTANPGLNAAAITGYTWSLSPTGAGSIVSGQGTSSVIINFDSTILSYSVKVTPNSACGSRVPRGLNVTKQGPPSTPSLILNSFNPNIPAVTNVCGLDSSTYQIRINAGSTSYNWSLKFGTDATIEHLSSGATDTAVRVIFSSGFTMDTLFVSASNVCGTGLIRKLPLRKSTSVPPAPLSITGQSSPCSGSTYNYTAAAYSQSATQAPLGGFRWTLPANASIISSNADSSSVNIQFNSSFSGGTLTIRTQSACGVFNSATKSLTLRFGSLPPAASSLTGESSPCNGSTYTYTATAFSPSSTQTTLGSIRWYLPANTSISSSNADSTSVNISFSSLFTGGSITVRTQSECGILNSSFKTLALKFGTPSVKAISGELSPCRGTSYVYSDTANTITSSQNPIVGFRWTRPAGTTVTSANSDSSTITISFGSTYNGGVISSYGVNACGKAGSAKSITLKYLPPTPTSISSRTGNFNACIGDTISYTVVVPAPSSSQLAAVQYRWTKPTTATIIATNADSSKITLQFNSGYTGGSLTVRGVTACGTLGSIRSATLTHNSCPTGTKFAFAATDSEKPMEVIVYPNPSHSGFNLKVNSISQSLVTVRVMDIQGKTIEQMTMKPTEVRNFGNRIAPGSYLIETRQGNLIKTTRVVRY